MRPLESYLDLSNPKLPEYTRLAENMDHTHLYSCYADHLYSILQEEHIAKQIQAHVRGLPWVDLGCGPRSYSTLKKLAVQTGAECYIGADLGFKATRSEMQEIPCHFIAEDILLTAAKVKSASAAFSFSGIDFVSRYADEIVDEVTRATAPNSIVLSYESQPIEWSLKERPEFTRLSLQGKRAWPLKVFQRKS